MKSKNRQFGFLMVAAVILLVVISFTAYAIVYMMIGKTHTETDYLVSKQAFYVAEGGLERGVFALLSPHVTLDTGTELLKARYSCSDINFTGQDLGPGKFSVTSINTKPFDPNNNAALINNASGITADDKVIPVTSLTGYASRGRVMIDREIIDYSGTSETECGAFSTPCFTGVVRGKAGTTAVSHNDVTPVSQYQCDLESQGGIPDLSGAISSISRGKHTIKTSVQLQKGLLVGNIESGETIGYWDGKNWTRVTPTGIPDVNLNGISMLSYAVGWAVGDERNNRPYIIKWQNNEWVRIPTNQIVRIAVNGNAISCVDNDYCWIVANKEDDVGPVFIEKTGDNWVRGEPSSTSDSDIRNLFGVYCLERNNCWAVGQRERNTSATIFHWSGGPAWQRENLSSTDVPVERLLGVYCTSANDCWAVGNNQTIVHYDGSWSKRDNGLIAGTNDLFAITCVNSNDCWAVGENALFIHWNGTTWSVVLGPGGSQTYRGISCYASNDCWAVGRNRRVAHWDGNLWTRVNVNSEFLNATAFNSISLVGVKQNENNANPKVSNAWFEDFS